MPVKQDGHQDRGETGTGDRRDRQGQVIEGIDRADDRPVGTTELITEHAGHLD